MKSESLPALGKVLAVAAAVLILGLTMVPLRTEGSIQWIPLVATLTNAHRQGWTVALFYAIGNVALFMPLGGALALRSFGATRAVLSAFFFSAAIELTQLAIPGRTTSVDDVLFNTLGGALGFVVVRTAVRKLESRAPRPNVDGARP